jgi:hypothetical protein
MRFSEFLQLLPSLPLLLAGIGVGYWLWVLPRPSLTGPTRGVLILILLTLSGGFFGGFFWWPGIPGTFAWKLPPLAGRMLSMAGWAFTALCVMTLRWPSRRRVRLALWVLGVYLVPIAAALLIAHRDRLDWAAPISYAFVLIAGGMAAATVYFIVRQPDIPAVADDPAPSDDITRKWLALVGGISLLWGIALFITDSGPTPYVWAWPGDLLTSRLIAVMLLAIATGCALSMRYEGPARAMLVTTLVYGLGVAAAGLWSLTAAKAIPLGYVAAFGAIGLGSGALLALERSYSLQ